LSIIVSNIRRWFAEAENHCGSTGAE